MMRSGDTVRLTSKDLDDLELVTGLMPPTIRTIQELQAFIERSKEQYSDDTEDGVLVRTVIDRTASRLVRDHIATPLTFRRKKPSPLRQLALDVCFAPLYLFRALFPRRVPTQARVPSPSTAQVG